MDDKPVTSNSPHRNNKEGIPYAHYLKIYQSLDPEAIGLRCALPYDRQSSAFSLRLLGRSYRVPFPDFALIGDTAPGPWAENGGAGILGTGKIPVEYILILRYLCEGTYIPPKGKPLSYPEVPWGNVYYRNFEGRCIKRLAYTFGRDIGAFKSLMEGNAEFRAEALPQGDAGYRLEFINGLFISLFLWAGDDEFPPSAQILFDDNFVSAFTAEDLAVVGEVVIKTLKERSR